MFAHEGGDHDEDPNLLHEQEVLEMSRECFVHDQVPAGGAGGMPPAPVGLDPSMYEDEIVDERVALMMLNGPTADGQKRDVDVAEGVMCEVDTFMEKWKCGLGDVASAFTFVASLPQTPTEKTVSFVELLRDDNGDGVFMTSFLWIFWDCWLLRTGRILSLAGSEIIYKGPGSDRCNVESFLQAYESDQLLIRIPSVGVSMIRSRAYRAVIPKEVMRVAQFFRAEASVAQDSSDDDVVPETCFICGTNFGHVKGCSLCLLPTHAECSARMLPQVEELPVEFPSLPMKPGSSWCRICLHFASV